MAIENYRILKKAYNTYIEWARRYKVQFLLKKIPANLFYKKM